MNLKTLILAIGIAILGFWVIGLLIRLTAWALGLILFIGLVMVISSLLQQYSERKK